MLVEFLGGFLELGKKNMIILLDEAQDLNKKDMKQIINYYDSGFFKSVVLVSKEEDMKLTENLVELINENKFKLGNLTDIEAIKMIRNRVGNLKFISDEAILKIFYKNKNSRVFLKNCEDVCKYTFELGDKTIEEQHVEEILK